MTDLNDIIESRIEPTVTEADLEWIEEGCSPNEQCEDRGRRAFKHYTRNHGEPDNWAVQELINGMGRYRNGPDSIRVLFGVHDTVQKYHSQTDDEIEDICHSVEFGLIERLWFVSNQVRVANEPLENAILEICLHSPITNLCPDRWSDEHDARDRVQKAVSDLNKRKVVEIPVF